jgi:hypothetical protein
MISEIRLQVIVQLPWWWRMYAASQWYACRLRGRAFDVEATANFITNHVRYIVKAVK